MQFTDLINVAAKNMATNIGPSLLSGQGFADLANNTPSQLSQSQGFNNPYQGAGGSLIGDFNAYNPFPSFGNSLLSQQRIPTGTSLALAPQGVIPTGAPTPWSGQASQAAATPPTTPATTPAPAPAPSPAPAGNIDYRVTARSAAVQYGIDPNVFIKQIDQESGFNPNAISPAGAIGIAQFMPDTAEGLGIDPRNPVQALAGAAHWMSQLQAKYGPVGALIAYNAGPGVAQQWLNSGMNPATLPSETQRYLSAILGVGNGW